MFVTPWLYSRDVRGQHLFPKFPRPWSWPSSELCKSFTQFCLSPTLQSEDLPLFLALSPVETETSP